jgi:hypothetical protein
LLVFQQVELALERLVSETVSYRIDDFPDAALNAREFLATR